MNVMLPVDGKRGMCEGVAGEEGERSLTGHVTYVTCLTAESEWQKERQFA